MRVSLKVDYALRAMALLAAHGDGHLAKAEHIASAQDIPATYLLNILNELKRAHLVRSQRGAEGGYGLARPGAEISLADVIRAIEGSLVEIHGASLSELAYDGPARPLRDVWMAVRTSLRDVLETVTLADLVAGRLPEQVASMAERYRSDVRH